MDTTGRERWLQFGYLLTWGAALGALAFVLILSNISPTAPDARTGQTFSFNNHGHVFYVRAWAWLLFYGALFGGVAACFMFAAALAKRQGSPALFRLHPPVVVAALGLAAGFWAAIIAITLA